MEHWIRADRWRAELFRAHDTVPTNDIIAFGVALLGELAKRGAPHGALCPEMISVRREGSALRVQIDPKSWPTDPTQEMTLAMGSKSMTARPGIHYRAPEQFTAHEYDQRADCFAVGVMLYELAAGRLPFGQDKTRPFDVFLALKRGGFPSLRQLRRDIPDALVTAITSALALRVEERTQDTTTMASALRAIARSPAGAPTTVEMRAGPTAPTRAAPAPSIAPRLTGGQATASPLPERSTPDRAAVPLDPLRPIETKVLPVATQAAIAAFRAGQTQQVPLTGERPAVSATVRALQPSAPPPIPLGPPAQPAPVVTPTAPTTPTAPVPREVSLPIRAIVEAVTRQEPPVPAPPRQPDPPVSAPVRAAPPVAPVTRQPIVMVPPRAAPSSKPIVVAPAPPAPRVPVELVRERPLERTQVTGPPTQMERQLAPPAPPPRVERSVEPPAQPTVIAPPPPALVRATAPSAWPPPDVNLPVAPVQLPKPAAAPLSTPVAVPAPTSFVAPRPVSVPAPASVVAPDPPREDTARRSAGEITPPKGSAKVPAKSFGRRDAVILSGLLLLLGASAGLLFQLPSRAAAPAPAPQCEPGPGKVCPPPPEPVAMPDPTPIVCDPQKPCEPPKPSPKLTCFYDNYSKGQRRYLRGDRRGALEAFHAAEACMPRNPRLLQWLGRCYEELRERDEARAYYERYLRRRPRADDADYYRQRLDSLEHPNGGTPHDGGTR